MCFVVFCVFAFCCFGWLVLFAWRLVPCVFVLQPTPWMLHAPPQHRPIPRNRAPHVTQQPNATTTEFEQSSFWWDGQWDMSCPHLFRSVPPQKKKTEKGGEMWTRRARTSPDVPSILVFIFYFSLSLSFHSVSCRSSCAWLGWKLWWYNKMRGDDMQHTVKSSASDSLYTSTTAGQIPQSRVESSFHFNFLLFRLFFNRWWWEKMLSGFFVFVWNSWNHARVFRGEEQLGVNWRNNLRNVADG